MLFFSQFAAELEQLDQLLPSLEKAAQLPGLCGPERSESGVAVKPEMLTAPLQPSAAARAPAGLNRRCPRGKSTARPQTRSLGWEKT